MRIPEGVKWLHFLAEDTEVVIHTDLEKCPAGCRAKDLINGRFV